MLREKKTSERLGVNPEEESASGSSDSDVQEAKGSPWAKVSVTR